MDTRIQHRGNCQCCGRFQAVRTGRMAKHGYTVKGGWFSGVCGGHQYAPMQQDRTVTDSILASVAKDVQRLSTDLAGLKDGSKLPQLAKSGQRIRGERGRWEDCYVPYAEAPAHHQEAEVRADIWRTESRIRAGQSFMADMAKLVGCVHGQPLAEVEVAA